MQERIASELKKLVEYGRAFEQHTAFNKDSINAAQVNLALKRYQTLKTRALNLVRRACGADSDHYQELQRLSDGDREYRKFSACLGIIEAAQFDFEGGLLFDMKALISAELLGDFIEQAETLLGAGFYIPAASLAGAVLEDTLRKLWLKEGWEVPKETKIDPLNIRLAKAGTYNKLTQKEITAYADIRNNADHGHYDQFKREDVEDMVKWVRRFAEEHLR